MYIDRLLDSSLPHNLIQEYVNLLRDEFSETASSNKRRSATF